MKNNLFSNFSNFLKKNGVNTSSTLLIHSSYSKLKKEKIEPNYLLDFFIDIVNQGNLLLPTMSWRFVNESNPTFNINTTPSNTGFLTEFFRIHYAKKRSLHPTHSLSGLGQNIEHLLSDHNLSETPCSKQSPYYKLLDYDSWIIFINTNIDCCTLLHCCEELISPKIYCVSKIDKIKYKLIDDKGIEFEYWLRKHKTLNRNYYKVQDQLSRDNKVSYFQYGLFNIMLYKASDIFDFAYNNLQNDNSFLIAKNLENYRIM